MKKYFCDRCEVEIPPLLHAQVEIDKIRYDICDGECRDLIGTFKAKAEEIVEQESAIRRTRIKELQDQYWSKKVPVDAA